MRIIGHGDAQSEVAMAAAPPRRTLGARLRSASLLVVAGLMALAVTGCPRRGEPETGVDGPAASRPVAVPRDLSGYVGSHACRECHAEIADSYARHPMGQSAIRPEDEPDWMYEEVSRQFAPGGMASYEVRRDAQGHVTHHEIVRDAEGELLYDLEVPVTWGIGSGTRGRSYGCEVEPGVITRSPISWYTETMQWDLSPGFSADDSRRFFVRISSECLSCHTGQMELFQGDERRITGFRELAIGCENCHGPGREHIDYHYGSLSLARDPIVNPVDLDPIRREDVCNQCHLQPPATVPRYGATRLAFQPGDRLDELLTFLVGGDTVDERGKMRSVSHVTQMHESACFQRSAGKMGCISCHDPHRKPASDERVTYFRERCIACHDAGGCALPEPQRLARQADDSCIACHMPAWESRIPHTAQTDHRILRRPEPHSQSGTGRSSVVQLDFFNGSEESLEPWEAERARALGLIRFQQATFNEPPLLAAIEQRLLPVLEVVPDDVVVLSELGAAAIEAAQFRRAARYFQRALAVEPEHETSLAGMVVCAHANGDYEAGLEYMRRLDQISRWRPNLYQLQAEMFWALGRHQEALEAAEWGLELDPPAAPLRSWLADAYRQLGDSEASQRHFDFLERQRRLVPSDAQRREQLEQRFREEQR